MWPVGPSFHLGVGMRPHGLSAVVRMGVGGLNDFLSRVTGMQHTLCCAILPVLESQMGSPANPEG